MTPSLSKLNMGRTLTLCFQVEAIRDRHMNKKLSLETQLKNLVSSQLKEAKDGIEKLATSIKLLAKLKKEYVESVLD